MKRRLLPLLLLAALPTLPAGAATFTVTKTADTLDGACDRDCSLREAVSAANADDDLGGADVVVVPPGIYALTRTGAGEDGNATGDLDLNDQMILVGAGAGSTVIDGNGADRVLDLRAPIEIDGVTVRNGRADGDGGGLLVRPNPAPQPVLLRRGVVSGNEAGGDGGGISAPEDTLLEVRDSAILENQAGGDGGGIAGIGFKLINVTVSDNRADGSGGGLAYEYGHGELVSGSTIVFNQAAVSGGGIQARPPLFPGTFSGQIVGSIVSDNFAPAVRDCGAGSLGYNVIGVAEGCSPQPTDRTGTAEHPLSAVFRLQDTRLGPTPVHVPFFNSPALDMVPAALCEPADQVGQPRQGPCEAGALEKVANPVCRPGGSVLCLQGGRFRVSAARIERFPSRGAQAAPLTDDTGNYWLFAPDNLEIMVKVLDGCGVNGHWWVFASGLTDVGVHLDVVDLASGRTWFYEPEAGATFPPRLDTDAFPCSGPDAGGGDGVPAPLPSVTRLEEVFRVTRTTDTDDGFCDHDCSLREAVLAANARPTTSVIVLGPGVYPLTLAGLGENAARTGDLDVTGRLVILGAGADRTAIDGQALDRVLDVRPAGGSLELHDLAVHNGWSRPDPTSGEGGGGIQAAGPLTLVRTAVAGNRADFWGGGILALGLFTMRDGTVSGNLAGTFGGGIAAFLFDLENVTVADNHAGNWGGGLYTGGDASRLVNATVTGNSATVGGGIAVILPTCPVNCIEPSEISRTVVAGNTVTPEGSNPDCFDMPDFHGGFNLFGVGAGCNPQPGDRSGGLDHPLDPRLSPLGDHGGPTPTRVPLADSPLVDAAPAASCLPADQRGLARPAGAGCDAGAVERQASCEPDAFTLCLGASGRFRVTSAWTAQGGSGGGKAVPLALETGAFWFFDEANLELTVKVLNGCGVNDRFWVFLSGLTDVGVEVRVEDTVTGGTWTHTHTAGSALQPRLDTSALEVCP